MSRVLFLDQYGSIGGGQTVLLSLLRAATATGATLTVLAPGGGSLQAAIAKEFGGAIAFVSCEEARLTHGRKGLGDVLALLAYGRRFRKHLALLQKQDVIWVNGLRHLPHMLRLSRKLRARVIYHVHIAHSRLEKMLLRRAARLRQTFRLVANSRFVADDFGFDGAKLTVIENALDSPFADLPFVDRFMRGTNWVGAVIGTLRPEKGQDVAIAAVTGLDMTLHLIGNNGDGAADWIASLPRLANVYFDGSAPDVPQTLDALGVQFNLVPSRWREPFGLVAIEGMACSCLTIVSGTGGLAGIAAKTGALVAQDAAALSEMLDALCARPRSELAVMAKAQYDAVQHHYAPARFAADIAALLAEASASSRQPL